jgi:hypothetical protein
LILLIFQAFPFFPTPNCTPIWLDSWSHNRTNLYSTIQFSFPRPGILNWPRHPRRSFKQTSDIASCLCLALACRWASSRKSSDRIIKNEYCNL